jgi:hypothetical protein
MVRAGALGKASPYRSRVQFGSFPLIAGRSRAIAHGACMTGVAMQELHSQVRPAPPPVAAFASRVALWEGFPL